MKRAVYRCDRCGAETDQPDGWICVAVTAFNHVATELALNELHVCAACRAQLEVPLWLVRAWPPLTLHETWADKRGE